MIVEDASDFDHWPDWFVVHLTGRYHNRARYSLDGAGFAVFDPMRRERIRKEKKFIWVKRTMFPQYLFVSIDLSQSTALMFVEEVYGVRSVLRNDRGNPSPIDVELLKDIHKASVDGVFDRIKNRTSLKANEKVRWIDGPFAGIIAELATIHDELSGLVIMKVLGKTHHIRAELDQLESI